VDRCLSKHAYFTASLCSVGKWKQLTEIGN